MFHFKDFSRGGTAPAIQSVSKTSTNRRKADNPSSQSIGRASLQPRAKTRAGGNSDLNALNQEIRMGKYDGVTEDEDYNFVIDSDSKDIADISSNIKSLNKRSTQETINSNLSPLNAAQRALSPTKSSRQRTIRQVTSTTTIPSSYNLYTSRNNNNNTSSYAPNSKTENKSITSISSNNTPLSDRRMQLLNGTSQLTNIPLSMGGTATAITPSPIDLEAVISSSALNSINTSFDRTEGSPIYMNFDGSFPDESSSSTDHHNKYYPNIYSNNSNDKDRPSTRKPYLGTPVATPTVETPGTMYSSLGGLKPPRSAGLRPKTRDEYDSKPHPIEIVEGALDLSILDSADNPSDSNNINGSHATDPLSASIERSITSPKVSPSQKSGLKKSSSFQAPKRRSSSTRNASELTSSAVDDGLRGVSTGEDDLVSQAAAVSQDTRNIQIQRPPSRQRTAFPTNLADLELHPAKAFMGGTAAEPKGTTPTARKSSEGTSGRTRGGGHHSAELKGLTASSVNSSPRTQDAGFLNLSRIQNYSHTSADSDGGYSPLHTDTNTTGPLPMGPLTRRKSTSLTSAGRNRQSQAQAQAQSPQSGGDVDVDSHVVLKPALNSTVSNSSSNSTVTSNSVPNSPALRRVAKQERNMAISNSANSILCRPPSRQKLAAQHLFGDESTGPMISHLQRPITANRDILTSNKLNYPQSAPVVAHPNSQLSSSGHDSSKRSERLTTAPSYDPVSDGFVSLAHAAGEPSPFRIEVTYSGFPRYEVHSQPDSRASLSPYNEPSDDYGPGNVDPNHHIRSKAGSLDVSGRYAVKQDKLNAWQGSQPSAQASERGRGGVVGRGANSGRNSGNSADVDSLISPMSSVVIGQSSIAGGASGSGSGNGGQDGYGWDVAGSHHSSDKIGIGIDCDAQDYGWDGLMSPGSPWTAAYSDGPGMFSGHGHPYDDADDGATLLTEVSDDDQTGMGLFNEHAASMLSMHSVTLETSLGQDFLNLFAPAAPGEIELNFR